MPTLSIAGSTSAGHPRTPVESYQAPTESTSQTGSDASQTLSDSSPAKRAAGNDTSPTVLSMPASPAPAPVAVSKSAPHKPEPISYWELPDAIREEVPVIKFSVLVYANNPKDRFVLINGQRYGEGDTMSGLHLEEIRRDGVVISYRLYKFLVER
jgi:general secretion pathway protein B